MKKIILVYFNVLAVLSVICQPIFAQTPQIGDTFQGGIVFYLESGGYSGLIAAPSDQSSGAVWGCYGSLISCIEIFMEIFMEIYFHAWKYVWKFISLHGNKFPCMEIIYKHENITCAVGSLN